LVSCGIYWKYHWMTRNDIQSAVNKIVNYDCLTKIETIFELTTFHDKYGTNYLVFDQRFWFWLISFWSVNLGTFSFSPVFCSLLYLLLIKKIWWSLNLKINIERSNLRRESNLFLELNFFHKMCLLDNHNALK